VSDSSHPNLGGARRKPGESRRRNQVSGESYGWECQLYRETEFRLGLRALDGSPGC
jgi:hypothetical protein